MIIKMGFLTILLGFSWLMSFMNIGYTAVLPVNHIIENSLDEPSFNGNEKGKGNFEHKDWVMVKEMPPNIIRASPGQRVELECTVFGSPVPQAQWNRGIQLNQITIGPNEFESSGEYQGAGKVTVRHVIDCIQPHHQGVYTCTGQAREQSIASDPVSIIVEGRGSQCASEKTSRVTKWSPVLMQMMGTTVMIPCSVSASTPYRHYWMDNYNRVINFDVDPRHKLGPEGELILNELSWSDMGEYTCIVENSISRDSASTFLYPMLPNDV
ncbi:neural/ectodermal development factor IMP-L2 isoform X2 [Daktulosphaira vitifoliae]|nr:neural/ectodermal development factor IMP-L2 isoform X2 [Daktulosphaira vitifoliae]